MGKYQDEINNLLLNTAVNKKQVFDFSFAAHVEEFQKTFAFYRQTLDQSVKWGIQNIYIFFINDTTANAKAGVSNGFGVIA
ncbi:hypothetical protein [Flavobacterium ginsengiterrae]|uniref:Uncharacterized protein n=1 Tax=Flavobacterium ginsengiterrae TaxID=871695 RepID=A0ABP7GSY6_9FLAO